MSEDTQREIEQILLTLRQCIDNLASILDSKIRVVLCFKVKLKGGDGFPSAAPTNFPGVVLCTDITRKNDLGYRNGDCAWGFSHRNRA